MSYTEPNLDSFISAPRPWVYASDWPEPVGANPDSIRATVFVGDAAKHGFDAVIVRPDGRLLQLINMGKHWRISSANFIGSGSKIDAQVVRSDFSGNAIPPKKGILHTFIGDGSMEFSSQEAITIALCFNNSENLPSEYAWWPGRGKS